MVIIFFVTCSYSSPRSSPSFFFFFLPQVGEGGKGPRPTHRVNHVHHHHITIFLSLFAIVPLPGIIDTNPASPSLLIPCIWQRGTNGGTLGPLWSLSFHPVFILSFLIWHFCLLASFIIHSHPIWPSLSGPNCKVRLKMHCAGTFGCKTRYSGPAFSRLSRDLPQQDQTNAISYIMEWKAKPNVLEGKQLGHRTARLLWSGPQVLCLLRVK